MKPACELKAGERIRFDGKWRKISYVAKSAATVTVYFSNSEMQAMDAGACVETR